MSAVVVQTYSPQDQAQVRDIFFESSSKKSFLDDEEKRGFEWKYLGCYLQHFPELAFVARNGNKVLGYVLGSTESDFETQPHLSAFDDLLTKYSAHLHINCHAESRGLGVGSLLIGGLEEKLQALNCNGLHIMTGVDARNRSFYQKLGFTFEAVRNFEQRPILMMGKTLTSLVSHT